MTVTLGLSCPLSLKRSTRPMRALGAFGLGSLEVPSMRHHSPTRLPHPTIERATKLCACSSNSSTEPVTSQGITHKIHKCRGCQVVTSELSYSGEYLRG